MDLPQHARRRRSDYGLLVSTRLPVSIQHTEHSCRLSVTSGMILPRCPASAKMQIAFGSAYADVKQAQPFADHFNVARFRSAKPGYQSGIPFHQVLQLRSGFGGWIPAKEIVNAQEGRLQAARDPKSIDSNQEDGIPFQSFSAVLRGQGDAAWFWLVAQLRW